MKYLKITAYVIAILTCLYALFLFIWNLSYTSEIGKIPFGKKQGNYFIFYTAVEVAEEFDDLKFDFYRNDSLIIKQKYFDVTDANPQISDIKVRNYNGLFYVTYFDSTKVKILFDSTYNVIFPLEYGDAEQDSISKLTKVKKLLVDKKLTLGRW